jgi:GGDEF domain-containing protein
MTARELIDYLSFDTVFGIYTRQGLEVKLSECLIDSVLFIIDFNHIHTLNKQVGYRKANEIIRGLFDQLRDNYPCDEIDIGRVFSGDEIAINVMTKDPANVIFNFMEICRAKNIGFKYIKYNLQKLTPLYHIPVILDKLSEDLQTNPTYTSTYENKTR